MQPTREWVGHGGVVVQRATLNTSPALRTSGVEITREINPTARKVYQSLRPPNPHLPYGAALVQLNRLPANVSVVPEIRRFHACNATVELVNGTVGLRLIPSNMNELIRFLHAISRVVFATGFRYSFPFLPQFHNPSASASPHPIVTDGTHLRSLYEDFLYTDEPTIGFLNMNWGAQTFTYAEYLSLALAKIWARKARGGYGRHLQFLGAKRTAENIRFFVAWLNDAAVKFGGRQIWAVWTQARYGETITQRDSGDPVASVDWIHGEDW
ncbi:hypothetical protein B0H13DRAFT_2341716 [Mycena leptocephala]|nr:hypothetical protein B0H13DRAFT_2341716 [Mycena leptocephala]